MIDYDMESTLYSHLPITELFCLTTKNKFYQKNHKIHKRVKISQRLYCTIIQESQIQIKHHFLISNSIKSIFANNDQKIQFVEKKTNLKFDAYPLKPCP